MSSVFVHVRRLWRDHIVGPQLPTYDRACEELGGVPWRPKPEATDRWFIVESPSRPRSATPPPLPAFDRRRPLPKPSVDSASFVLKKSLSEGAKLTLLGGCALAVIFVCLASLLGGPATPATAVATTTPATAAPILLAAVMPAPLASASSAKSSAPRAFVGVHSHSALAKHRVAARHRRR